MRPLVMVVDDDMAVRDAYREVFEQSGFRVVGLADGRMALDYLRAQPLPDVIVLDMVMPGMDGFDLRMALLSQPRWAAIPTVVVTADRRVSQRWSTADVFAFLTKPVEVPQLLSTVARAVHQREVQPTAAQLASARDCSTHESMPR